MTSNRSATLDLGVVDAPLFVFGGPYSNLAATRRVIEIATERGFPADRIVCTGDIIAYCAHPAETLEAIRSAGINVVMGNCEESLGEQLDDCGCGFEEGSACDVLSRSWYAYAQSKIDDDARAWMRGLPRRIEARVAGLRIVFLHGDSSNISGWVFASTPADDLTAHFDNTNADVIVGGHCGLPFARRLGDGRAWINAGVVGMPANDGTKRGWFATLHPGNGAIAAELMPFTYDTGEEARAMAQNGLPDGYRNGLIDGLWPNMDVLPGRERATRGIALQPRAITIRARTGMAA